MYVIVQLGSTQFKVSEGDTISAQKIDEQEGKSVTLDKVLLVADGPDIQVGQPFLKNVRVTAKVVEQTLDKKKISYKYRRRKHSAWKKGHRQKLTILNIAKISAGKDK